MLLALGLSLAGCRLGVREEVAVAADGSGSLALTFELDPELAGLLEDAGVELEDDLPAVEADGWEVGSEVLEDGTERVRIATGFADPAELRARVEELHGGLDEDDPALLRDVELEVDERGAASFAAQAGLELPDTAGASGTGVAVTGEDLERIVAEGGEDVLTVELAVTLPGRPTTHDADVVSGRTMSWRIEPGTLVAVSAASAPPTVLDRYGDLAMVGAGVAATLILLAWGLLEARRRRRRRMFR